MSGALSHIRVLDLSRILAGPWATQMLADLGADVIKVERPGTGDDTRSMGPPFIADADGAPSSDAAYFACINRNKRSVTIDFTRPEGQALVRSLAAKSDVVVENFKVGGLAQYGLDYASLAPLNPAMIYCSVTGFGQDGPYAGRAGYDFVAQAMGGLMSVTGRPDGEPGGGPVRVGVAISDILTGLFASNAILAALAWRERSGRGQYVDMALLDVQVACLANQAMNYFASGTVPRRTGNTHPNVTPYQEFRTADGYLVLAVANDGQFARMARAVGQPDWAEDARFRANADRMAHREELAARLGAVLATRTTAAWIALFESHAVPCAPINDLGKVFGDPQVRSRGMQIQMRHGAGADISLLANPMRLSETPVEYRRPPPLLGEHTREVLREVVGVSQAEIDALAADGVI